MTRTNRIPPRPGGRLSMTLEEEVAVEVQRSATAMARWVAEALKPSGLTPPQFNVLRILRGARPEALCARVIAERMITYDPDLTRIIDRLEAGGWVRKSRDDVDRRKVSVQITTEGVDIVDAATGVVRQRLAQALEPAGAARLETLIDLLHQMREADLGRARTASGASAGTSPAASKTTTRSRTRPTRGKKS